MTNLMRLTANIYLKKKKKDQKQIDSKILTSYSFSWQIQFTLMKNTKLAKIIPSNSLY